MPVSGGWKRPDSTTVSRGQATSSGATGTPRELLHALSTLYNLRASLVRDITKQQQDCKTDRRLHFAATMLSQDRTTSQHGLCCAFQEDTSLYLITSG